MKKALKPLLGVIAVCAMVICMAAPAAASPDAGGYTITDYAVNVAVSSSNVYDITETIKVNFYEDGHHGIYRDIPFIGTMRILNDDGQEVDQNYRATITNISVPGYDSSVSTYSDGSDKYKEIKIGSANYTVSGPMTYVISYKMNFGDDGIPSFDMLNYNLIGTQWGTTIDHASFTITMPSPFDASKLGFSLGTQGTSGYDAAALKFSVSGNTISGEVVKQMVNYEGLTVSMRLPQGYFQVPDPRIPDWIMMGFLALLALVALFLFFVYGRDEKPVQTVEFNAPDDLTPAEVGYINDGVVDTRDVVSLILYWADKGYLAIQEEAGSFTLLKKTDIGSSAKPFEKNMFDKLFKTSDTVTTDDLKYSFYTTVNTTKSSVADSFERDDRRVFTKASTGLKPLMSFLAALPVMLTLFMTYWRNGDGLIATCIYTVLAGVLILMPVFFLIGTLRKWRAYKPGARVTYLILEMLLILVTICIFVAFTAGKVYEPMLPWWAGLMTIIIALVAVFIVKRTPKGVEWLGKISGFREFIVLAERDKIIAMVKQDPSYFYHVLPYAYVLNVTDKWAKQFEAIALEPPQWYYGYNYSTFNSLLFIGALNSSMNSFRSSMTSVPSSNGGGGGGSW